MQQARPTYSPPHEKLTIESWCAEEEGGSGRLLWRRRPRRRKEEEEEEAAGEEEVAGGSMCSHIRMCWLLGRSYILCVRILLHMCHLIMLWIKLVYSELKLGIALAKPLVAAGGAYARFVVVS